MKTILRSAPLLLLLALTGCYVVPPATPVAYAAPQPVAYYAAPAPVYYAPAYYAPYPTFALGVYGGGRYYYHR